MRLIYDPELDVAHLLLEGGDASADGGDASALARAEVGGVPAGGYVDAEFDSAGRLVGFEVLGARRVLPPEVLAEADRG